MVIMLIFVLNMLEFYRLLAIGGILGIVAN